MHKKFFSSLHLLCTLQLCTGIYRIQGHLHNGIWASAYSLAQFSVLGSLLALKATNIDHLGLPEIKLAQKLAQVASICKIKLLWSFPGLSKGIKTNFMLYFFPSSGVFLEHTLSVSCCWLEQIIGWQFDTADYQLTVPHRRLLADSLRPKVIAWQRGTEVHWLTAWYRRCYSARHSSSLLVLLFIWKFIGRLTTWHRSEWGQVPASFLPFFPSLFPFICCTCYLVVSTSVKLICALIPPIW